MWISGTDEGGDRVVTHRPLRACRPALRVRPAPTRPRLLRTREKKEVKQGVLQAKGAPSSSSSSSSVTGFAAALAGAGLGLTGLGAGAGAGARVGLGGGAGFLAGGAASLCLSASASSEGPTAW